jgi:hypothetical protein
VTTFWGKVRVDAFKEAFEERCQRIHCRERLGERMRRRQGPMHQSIDRS